MLKNNKGITLIALVITIIVLLILAGVSIAMLTGENGILTQAERSKEDTEAAEIADKINMALNGEFTNLLADNELTGTSESEIQTNNGLDTNYKATSSSSFGPSTTEDTVILKISNNGIEGSITFKDGGYKIDRAPYPDEDTTESGT